LSFGGDRVGVELPRFAVDSLPTFLPAAAGAAAVNYEAQSLRCEGSVVSSKLLHVQWRSYVNAGWTRFLRLCTKRIEQLFSP